MVLNSRSMILFYGTKNDVKVFQPLISGLIYLSAAEDRIVTITLRLPLNGLHGKGWLTGRVVDGVSIHGLTVESTSLLSRNRLTEGCQSNGGRLA